MPELEECLLDGILRLLRIIEDDECQTVERVGMTFIDRLDGLCPPGGDCSHERDVIGGSEGRKS
jgi:hypothetical protein